MAIQEHKTIKGVGLHRSPHSFAHVKDITPLNSHLANFLKAFASEDVYYRKWEFDGNALIDDFWTLASDATATDFTVPSPQELGGVLLGSTGATDNGGLSMRGPTVVKGDKRAYLHVHFSVSAITSLQFEIGFIDAITDPKAPVITDVDTPASGNGASDIAVVHMDTDQTLKTMALVTDGVTTGMACGKVNIGTLTPTAATEMCIRLMVDVNDVSCWVDNQRSYYKGRGPNVIEGGTLLMPWIFFRTRVATNRDVRIHMVEIMGEK